MSKNCSDFRKMYDQMKESPSTGGISRDKLKELRESDETKLQGKMGITSAINAFDKVFTPGKTVVTEQKKTDKKVLTEKEARSQRMRMLGAIQVIKERLDEGVNAEDVNDVVEMIKEIVSEL